MSFDIRREKSNIIWVIFSNLIALIVGLVTSFLVPKYVSLATYANYKTYSLYIAYVGLFHFGFINGIYLKYGKVDYDDLPKDYFSLYIKVLIGIEFFVLVSGNLVGNFIWGDGWWSSPYFYVCINILPVNINCFFSLTNQFGKRFKIDSIMLLFTNSIISFLFVVLIAKGIDDYTFYLNSLTLSNYFILLLWLFINRGFITSPSKSLIKSINGLAGLFKRGFFVMISEYIGLIIVGVDSIFVNLFFSREEYSIYSFAVSVISLMFGLVSIISKLIYPYLARIEKEKYKQCYITFLEATTIIAMFFGVLLVFLDKIILLLIPKYAASCNIIAVLSGVLILKCLQELVFGNFYKVLGAEKFFVRNNMVALVLGVVSDIVVFVCTKNMIFFAWASLFTYIFWAFISIIYFKKSFNIVKSDVVLFMYILGNVFSLVFLLKSINIISLLVVFILVIGLFMKTLRDYKKIK